MAAYNFGLQNRDMTRAGMNALKLRSGLSFSSIGTIGERWGEFCGWAKEEGIRYMEKIQREDVIRYGRDLAERVATGELSAKTAQNYLSAVNRVMGLARGDRQVWVSPTRETGIPKKSGVAVDNRAVSESDHHAALERVSPRVGALLGLQRSLGLRFKEG